MTVCVKCMCDLWMFSTCIYPVAHRRDVNGLWERPWALCKQLFLPDRSLMTSRLNPMDWFSSHYVCVVYLCAVSLSLTFEWLGETGLQVVLSYRSDWRRLKTLLLKFLCYNWYFPTDNLRANSCAITCIFILSYFNFKPTASCKVNSYES